MPSFLSRTLLALEECEQHLTDTQTLGTSVESYLTQHILVVMCAEMQQEIYRIIDQRASRNPDAQIRSFVSAAQPKILRSVKTSEISGYFAYFQTDYKEILINSITEQEISAYNNAVGDRHDIAHRQGANVTFDELKKACSVAVKILEAANINFNPP